MDATRPFREFAQKLSSPIFYDSAAGGADFVLSLPERRIAIEVGYGKKPTGQAESTLKKIGGKYGLVVCNSELAIEGQVVKVPLEYFLLM